MLRLLKDLEDWLKFTRQADILYDFVERGLSSKESTVCLNIWRGRQVPPLYPICRSTIQLFISQNPSIKTSKIQAKKSGESDIGCDWAVGRCNQAKHIDQQLKISCRGNRMFLSRYPNR